jgi:hypothetical protein
MMRIPSSLSVMIITAISLTLLVSCSEEFPPYDEPTNVLAGEISVTAADTIDAYFDTQSGQWYLSTPVILSIDITNTYDNLLQGAARVNGMVTIQSFADIPRTMVVQLTLGNLRTPAVFHGDLGLAPGAKAQFSELWLPYCVDGTFVLDGLPYITIDADRIYGPITFICSAQVQLFERVQPIRFGDFTFTRTFRQRF